MRKVVSTFGIESPATLKIIDLFFLNI